MRPSLVYFIRPRGKRGPIKIGTSSVPENRLNSLTPWSPWPLEVMGAVPGSYSEESFLHQCFAASHQHGEWFKATPHVRGFIAKIIAAGSIDAVRGEIAPVGQIKGKNRRKRTDNEKLRSSYGRRVQFCQQRVRKTNAAWYAPSDVQHIISNWRARRYWSAERREYVAIEAVIPSPAQIARLDEYLANPVPHSVVPSWSIKKLKDSICIPVLGQEEQAAA